MTGSQRLIPVSDQSGWHDATSGVETWPAHTHWYNQAISATTENDIFLYYFRAETGAVTVAPICRRWFGDNADIYSPYGNGGFARSGDFNGFWPAHRDFMMDQGIVCANISLNQYSPALELFPTASVELLKPVFVIDTTKDLQDLWQSFGRNNRRHLKNWRASESAEFVEDHAQLVDAFLRLYPDFSERLGVKPRHRLDHDTLRLLLENPENAKLIGVRDIGGEISLVRCFLYTGTNADAFLEASTPDGRGHSRAVYWRAYEWAHNFGIRRLNLSGGISAGDSLEFFKKDLGGDRHSLYRTRLIYDQDRFKALCEQTGNSAEILPGAFFPPYHQLETGEADA